MAGEPPDMENFINHLLGYPNQPQDQFAASYDDRIKAPEKWLSQSVQLRNNQGTIQGTIPAFMCNQVGISKADPPRVSVYFDPITELVVYDISNTFRED